MKRFLLLLVVVNIIVTMYAQTSLADLLKGKTGKDVATLNPSVDAVLPELFIIRQQYRLKRDGMYYGKNNLPFYGENYTLGIKVAGGLIMQNRVVYPWMDDSDYHNVNKTGKYKPVRFGSYERNLSDSVYKEKDLELDSKYVSPIDTDSLIYKHTDIYADFGLSIDESEGKKTGYMLWAYASTDVQDSAMTVSLGQQSYTVSSDSLHVKMDPSDAGRVIGGLYVVPKYDRAGRVQFLLAGVASKNSVGNWILTLLAKRGKDSKLSDSKAKEQQESDAEPTPIKKNKKRK